MSERRTGGSSSATSDDVREIPVALEKAELFRVLGPERLARLRPLVHERRVAHQKILYFEGAPAERLWVVRSGEVRLYKGSASGQVTTLDVLGPGEIFGALSAAPGDVYPASAETVTDCTLSWVAQAVFERLLREDPQLPMEVLGIVSRRLREAHERLRSFAYDAAPTRLAQALLRFAPDGEARVTRRALAEASGTTVETAIRVLRRFECAGLVESEVGRVRILDPAGLRRAAGETRD